MGPHAPVDGKWMRMLTLGEKRSAMGFPEDYILPKSKKTAGIMLGNAVVPTVAESILGTIRGLIS